MSAYDAYEHFKNKCTEAMMAMGESPDDKTKEVRVAWRKIGGAHSNIDSAWDLL